MAIIKSRVRYSQRMLLHCVINCPSCLEVETYMFSIGLTNTYSCSKCGKELTVEISQTEKSPLYKDKDWLIENYIDEQKSMSTLARMTGVSPMTICQWLNKFEIPTRSRGRKKTE